MPKYTRSILPPFLCLVIVISVLSVVSYARFTYAAASPLLRSEPTQVKPPFPIIIPQEIVKFPILTENDRKTNIYDKIDDQQKNNIAPTIRPTVTKLDVSPHKIEIITVTQPKSEEIIVERKITVTEPPKSIEEQNWESTCEDGKPITLQLKYWRDVTSNDILWRSPYQDVGPRRKYLSFEPDHGGWNNIRMQLETCLVIAVATGRTLVLPPDQPLYLLNKNKDHSDNEHGFADFYPFDEIAKRIPVITMEDFLQKEGLGGDGVLKYQVPNDNVNIVKRPLWNYLHLCGGWPGMKPSHEYLVIPPIPGLNYTEVAYYSARETLFKGLRRPRVYDSKLWNAPLLHIGSASPVTPPPDINHPVVERTKEEIDEDNYNSRLLTHFYSFVFFPDPVMDRYFKRFVRDSMRYVEEIMCAASKVVDYVQSQSETGRFDSFHIRRGEFQYKEVKIPAADILNNISPAIHDTKEIVLFIASDERNKTFFNPFFTAYSKVFFLDDVMTALNMTGINNNFLGMVDMLIASVGDRFVGTWFSTFTGYITRIRGYNGGQRESVFYGTSKHVMLFQDHEYPRFPYYMREWDVGWSAIDEEEAHAIQARYFKNGIVDFEQVMADMGEDAGIYNAGPYAPFVDARKGRIIESEWLIMPD